MKLLLFALIATATFHLASDGLAGVKQPADLELDGISFLPVFENKAPIRSKPLLWIFYNALNERRVAMRDGEWKVLAKLNIDKATNVTSENEAEIKAATLSDFQIFRITEDIGESSDLSSAMTEKANELTRPLKESYNELLEGSHVWDVN